MFQVRLAWVCPLVLWSDGMVPGPTRGARIGIQEVGANGSPVARSTMARLKIPFMVYCNRLVRRK